MFRTNTEYAWGELDSQLEWMRPVDWRDYYGTIDVVNWLPEVDMLCMLFEDWETAKQEDNTVRYDESAIGTKACEYCDSHICTCELKASCE